MSKMITRTIMESVYEVMCVNIETAEVIKAHTTIYGSKTEKQIEKEIKSQYGDAVIKVVTWNKVATNEQVYGMTEELFMTLAVPVERCPSQQKKA